MRCVTFLSILFARLVQQAQDWKWSSVAAHLSCKDFKLVKVAPVLERYGDFKEFLSETTEDSAAFKPLRQSETTGRPLGSEEWIDKIEKVIGRTLKPQKRGPRKKTKSNK